MRRGAGQGGNLQVIATDTLSITGREGGMQPHKIGAWGLLLLVLGLDGAAFWAMMWQHDLRLSLVCVAVNVGLLLASYHLWRWGP